MTPTRFPRFLRDESGDVTVEWVVLAALLAGVGIASLDIHKDGLGIFSEIISTALTGETDKEFLSVDIVNGSFENTDGMTAADWGFTAATIEGWTSENGEPFEVIYSSYRGANSYDGDWALDMGSSPGNLEISQTFTNAQEGEWYNIALVAYDSVGNNAMEVYFGGEFVGSVVPGEADWHTYDFDVRGGMGDGSNKVTLKEVGVEDYWGTYLDSVGFYRLEDNEASLAEAAYQAELAAQGGDAGDGS